MLNRTELDALEKMIDRVGVSGTLEAIAHVCADKAEHIRANWQDAALAISWQRQGERVDGYVAAHAKMESKR